MSKKFLHTRTTEFSEVFLDVRDGGFLSGRRHEDEVFERGCHLEDVVGELIVVQDFSSVFKVARWFPCVVTDGVSFPLDEISISSTPFLVTRDSFYLVFFFSFDQVRRWLHEVRTMGFGFTIR